MNRLKSYIIILIFIFIINVNVVSSIDYNNFEVEDTFLCDEYGYEFDFSDPDLGDCYNAVSPSITTEQVFHTGATISYTCEDTESIDINIIYRSNALNNNGDYYDNRPFYYSWDFVCEFTGQRWLYAMWNIWDINANREVKTTPKIVIDNTKTLYANEITFTPSTNDPTDELTPENSLYTPYANIVTETVERGFGPTSFLGLNKYYDDDIVINDNLIDSYNEEFCGGDRLCLSMPTISGLKTNGETLKPDFVDITKLDYDDTYKGLRIGDDPTAFLINYFDDTSASPLLIRTEIEWESYNSLNGFPTDDSFKGYFYYYLVLGYDDSANDFLVQSSAGDRYRWDSTKIEERWCSVSGLAYGLDPCECIFFEKKDTYPNSNKNYKVMDAETNQEADYVTEGDYYYFILDPSTSSFYSETINPLFNLVFDGESNDYVNNFYGKVSDEMLIDPIYLASNDQLKVFYTMSDKVETVTDVNFINYIETSEYNVGGYINFKPNRIDSFTNNFEINFSSNFYGDTQCIIETESGDIVQEDNSDYTRDHNCVFDLSTFDLDPNDDITVKVNSVNPNTGEGDEYILPQLEKVNYPNEYSVSPENTRCINTGFCDMPSFDLNSNLGSYYAGDFYILPSSLNLYYNDVKIKELFSSFGTPLLYDYEGTLLSVVDFEFENYQSFTSTTVRASFEGESFYLTNGDVIEYCLYQYYDTGFGVPHEFDYCYDSVLEVRDGLLKDDVNLDYDNKIGTPDGEGIGSDYPGLYIESNNENAGKFDNDDYHKCTYNFDVDNNLPAEQFTNEKIWFDVNNNKDLDNIDYTTSLIDMAGSSCSEGNCYNYMNIKPDCFGDSTTCEVQLPYETQSQNKFYCNTPHQHFKQEVTVYSCFSNINENYIFEDEQRYINHLQENYDQTDCFSYSTLVPEFYNDGGSYNYNLENLQICKKNNILFQSGTWFCSPIGSAELTCKTDDEEFDYDGDGVVMQDDLCCGYDDSEDEDLDGIPDGCDYNTDINLTIANLCTNGVLDPESPVFETKVDYGGECGNCINNIIDPLIGEISVDYGGKCGNCSSTLIKPEDEIWLKIKEKIYPFNYSQCEQQKNEEFYFPFFILIVLFILPLIFLLLPLLIWILYFFIKKLFFKKNKKNKNKK